MSNWLDSQRGFKFIVLGETQDLKTSKRLIGRYKSEEELRDIFEADKLRKPARRKLLVFKVTDIGDPEAWFLVSFDIKEVIGKKTGVPRKATKEYTIIKDHAFFSCLCGRIDNSTYICPDPSLADFVRKYTEYVEVYPVAPYDSKTLNALKDSIRLSIAYIKAKLIVQSSKLRHGRARAKAREMLETLDHTLKRVKDKVAKLVDLTPLIEAKDRLENSLKVYEEKTIK